MQVERQEIRVFVAVVDCGGFSRAAERLGVSQSAVSQTVANLEHRLDVLLIERKGGVRLTEAGNRFLRFAHSVVHEERLALDDIGELKRGALSTLSLAMSSTVNRFFGPPLMLEFCERNPFTRLKLDVVPSLDIVAGVDDGRWEVGFGPFHNKMPQHFQCAPHYRETQRLVVHESHPSAAVLASDSSSVSELTLLTAYLDDPSRRPGSERLRNRFASAWEVSHLELRLDLAAAGHGVTYVPDRLLAELDGFNVIDGLEFSAMERDVGVFYNKHAALSEGAKRFVAIADRFFASSDAP